MSFEPQQEPEHVPGKRLAIIAAASVVITIVSIIIAWRIERATTRQPWTYSNVPPPAPLGTVERTLIGSTERGLVEQRAARAELDRWGWADRDAGVARVPIDRAIDLWIASQPQAPVGPPSAAPPPPRPVMPSMEQRAGRSLGVNPPTYGGR